jgi:hypothetical protein|nr:MAG TPA: RloB-like protein [Caudoviricetes sp.]
MMRGANWPSSRQSTVRKIGSNNLIICCGEQTEVNFFEKVCSEIKRKDKTNVNLNFDIIPNPVTPLQMTQDIEKQCLIAQRNSRPYQDVWVVFDKDDFEKDNFDNAISKLEKMSCARCHALWSNECIELWFLLHFEYLTADISRKQYREKLTRYLGEQYEKNNPHIISKILEKKGKISNAISNADKLLTLHKGKSYSNMKPATNMGEFFKKYLKYLEDMK